MDQKSWVSAFAENILWTRLSIVEQSEGMNALLTILEQFVEKYKSAMNYKELKSGSWCL